jgi:RHS repeat-associated protein
LIFGDSGIIYYIYDALGVKVGKTVTTNSLQQGTVVSKTDYLGGFQYLTPPSGAGGPQFFPTAEGYVKVTDKDKFNYVYNYTDHLGNIRLSYTFDGRENELKILEENHYYPFGLKHSNYNVDKVHFEKDETGFFAILKPVDRSEFQYKYNGKEFQDELNLNLYDYGATNYDPAIGRWINIDPLSETSRRFSPYTYCLNNPVYFIDPDGMQATPGPGDEFATLAAAANDFGNCYFVYSQDSQREIGTNFYQTANGSYSYAKPVMGCVDQVDISSATEGMPTDASIVGDGHTQPFVEGNQEIVRPLNGTVNPDPIGSEKAATLKLENFTTDGGPTNTSKYEIENGSNAPSAGDMDKYQDNINSNPNFVASYVFTGSGLVYSVKNDGGTPNSKVQGTISKTSSSTSKSSIRINQNNPTSTPPTIPREVPCSY